MTEWLFRRVAENEVQQEVTQLSQFSSDELSLQAALIREAHQNSLDAVGTTNPSPVVKTRIAFSEPVPELGSYYESLFEPLRRHLQACDVDVNTLKLKHPRSLVIEDFGTRGLWGNWRDRKEQNAFNAFWRNVGRSSKGGQSNGRWGLGKLVFSGSSAIRCMFGVTVPDTTPDGARLLMGQAVLKNRSVDNQDYAPHAFYARSNTQNGLQLPVDDPLCVEKFCRAFGITRRPQEPGLSVVIPFIDEEFSVETLKGEVLKNYFFPILSGKLEVDVCGEEITQTTFFDVARQYFGQPMFPSEPLIRFIQEIDLQKNQQPTAEFSGKRVAELDPYSISDERFQYMREHLLAGKLLHIRVHIILSHLINGESKGFFDLFLKNAPDEHKGQALFIRNSLTLPDEARKFSDKGIYVALIASGGPVSEFLGDAENPAHTKWSSTEERVKRNWRKPRATLTAIRNSLPTLFQIFDKSVQQIHEDALIDYFAIADPTGIAKKGKNKPKETVKPPIPNIPKKKKLYRIDSRHGGFSIKANSIDGEWDPFELRVRIAYDLLKGDPFAKFDRRDFDLAKEHLKITLKGAELIERMSNEFRISASDKNFQVDVMGFDPNRDLIVDARKI